MNDSDRKRIEELIRTAECGLKYQSWGNAAEVMNTIPWLLEMVEKQDKQIAIMKEALEDAIDGLANAVDDLQNCFDSGSVPIIDEVKSCRSYLTSVREALAEVKKLEEGK